MPLYRFFKVDKNGRIERAAESLDCADDHEAVTGTPGCYCWRCRTCGRLTLRLTSGPCGGTSARQGP